MQLILLLLPTVSIGKSCRDRLGVRVAECVRLLYYLELARTGSLVA